MSIVKFRAADVVRACWAENSLRRLVWYCQLHALYKSERSIGRIEDVSDNVDYTRELLSAARPHSVETSLSTLLLHVN